MPTSLILPAAIAGAVVLTPLIVLVVKRVEGIEVNGEVKQCTAPGLFAAVAVGLVCVSARKHYCLVSMKKSCTSRK